MNPEQKKKREKILKRVKINLFSMSLALFLFYIPIIVLLMIDIIEFLNQIDCTKIKISEKVIKYLAIYVCVYPMLESAK
ncbi:hypothetical protein HZS_871 [Henneguya salminicola]|nr:hypothetical protein HZS_871 [Henneguya salminicola]